MVSEDGLHSYDYTITCKSIVMLENVSEMPLCTVSEFAELLQLWLKRTTLLVLEMRERKVTRRNKGEIRALDVDIDIDIDRQKEGKERD